MKNEYLLASGIIFAIVAVLQAIRAFNQWPVLIGPIAVPVWFSWLAAIIAGTLCVWAFASRER